MSKFQMPDRVPLETSHAPRMRSCALRVDTLQPGQRHCSAQPELPENDATLLVLDEIGKGNPADGTTEAKLTLVMLRKRGGFNKEMYYLRRGQGRKIKRRSIHPIQKREII
ncbi:hypothetical protein NKI77_07295 [Mesorhizobium opportunistum]|uniref:Uncharacterized protein n=1 Tax=Mesorhizobium opportunistum TaxID=593909 RepID=A0ABV1YC35_9HYPH|nr:hypothetical protein [Mesorhizobium sp.]TJV16396.1 MAG: hypothetical protein E5Y07_18515 [Mesorhizobium sp.]